MRPSPPDQPKRTPPLALCVPSSYCLECPVELRAAVCFFKRPKPSPAPLAKRRGLFAILS